jgi:hypothetical protein
VVGHPNAPIARKPIEAAYMQISILEYHLSVFTEPAIHTDSLMLLSGRV